MCPTAGPDAKENGTDGMTRRGATWRPSKASVAGLGAQAKREQGKRGWLRSYVTERRQELAGGSTVG